MSTRTQLAVSVLYALHIKYVGRVSDLAREIGVGKSTIYTYLSQTYAPKKDISEAIVEVGFRHLPVETMRKCYETAMCSAPDWQARTKKPKARPNRLKLRPQGGRNENQFH